jgi:hypothetical protein
VFATVSAEEGSISGFLAAFFPLLVSAFLLIGSVVGTAFALAGRLTSSPAVAGAGAARGGSPDVPESPPATTGHAGVDMLLEQVRRSRSTVRARVSLDGSTPRYAVTHVVFGERPAGGDSGLTLTGAPPVGYRATAGDEVLLVLQAGAGGAGTWRAVRLLPIRDHAVTLVDRSGVSVAFAVESITMLLARAG